MTTHKQVALVRANNELQLAQLPPLNQIEGIQHLLAQRQKNVWSEFDGTYSKWASFRDLFRAAMNDHALLSNAQKFQQLKKSLKGEVKEALGEWQVTDENYLLAYERLHEIYDQKHMAACQLLDRVNNLEQLKIATNKGLQHLSDVANDVKRQLRGLGYDTQSWDKVFISTLQGKLDKATRKEWETKRDRQNPTLDHLLTIIETQARASGDVDRDKRHGEMQNHFHAFKKLFASNDTQNEKQSNGSPICAFCNGRHCSRRCYDYLAKHRNGREKAVREKKLCIHCLLPGHFARNCDADECDRSEGRHDRTLCRVSPSKKNTTIWNNSVV